MLQQRNISLRAVDTCPSMDLLAGLTEDGSLIVFRTMSWDKVIQKAGADIFGTAATALRFSPDGKLVALGAASGAVAIYDLEKASYVLALSYSPDGGSPTSHGAIAQLSWSHASTLSGCEWGKEGMWAEAWQHGGLGTVERAGLKELGDTDGEDIDTDELTLADVFQALHGFVLFAVTDTHMLGAYAFGLCPLYFVALDDHTCSHPWKMNEWSLGRSEVALYRRSDMDDLKSNTRSPYGLCKAQISRHLFSSFYWQERVAMVVASMSQDVDRLVELASQCSRKWKEATKLLPIKLGLLQTALEGYELPYNPVSFFYTVAMCGAWHPVAQTTFSSHWNDQGISRLRVGIDMGAKFISHIVKLCMIPTATNLQLRSRELEALFSVAKSETIYKDMSPDLVSKHARMISALKRSSECLLYKLDDMSNEVDLAHSGLMLFLQFIKEYHNACAGTPATISAISPDVQTMKAYMALFDPRNVRAPSTASAASKARSGHEGGHKCDTTTDKIGFCPPIIPLKTAEAESVCGTHLYAYLQEVCYRNIFSVVIVSIFSLVDTKLCLYILQDLLVPPVVTRRAMLPVDSDCADGELHISAVLAEEKSAFEFHTQLTDIMEVS